MIEWLLFYKFNIEKIMWFEFYFILLSTWSNRWKVLFQGIWVGMILGTVLQTVILVYIIYKTNWNKEVSLTVFVFFLKRKDYNNLEFGPKKNNLIVDYCDLKFSGWTSIRKNEAMDWTRFRDEWNVENKKIQTISCFCVSLLVTKLCIS